MKLSKKEKFIIVQALSQHIESINDEIEDFPNYYDGSIEGMKKYLDNLENYLYNTEKLFMKIKKEADKDE